MARPNDKTTNAATLVARTARGRLRNVSRKPTPIPIQDVIVALRGRSLGMRSGNGSAPVTLLSIRDALADRLRSTGGRPALSGEGSPQRVRVSADDWQTITDIAARVETGRHKPSPAQVASILIHLALKRLAPGEIDRVTHTDR